MLHSDERKPLASIHPIKLIAPPPLETALAYTGDSRWLGLYWELELNQVFYTNGQSVGMGNSCAWQLFRTHPQASPLLQPYHFGDDGQPAQHYLLLDRETRKLYVGESAIVEDYLRQPPILALLAAMDADVPVPTVEQNQQYWPAWFPKRTRTMIVISSTLLLLLGLSIVGLGAAVIAEEKDWLEVELFEWAD